MEGLSRRLRKAFHDRSPAPLHSLGARPVYPKYSTDGIAPWVYPLSRRDGQPQCFDCQSASSDSSAARTLRRRIQGSSHDSACPAY